MKNVYLRLPFYLVLLITIVLVPLPELRTDREHIMPAKRSAVKVVLIAPAPKKPEISKPPKEIEQEVKKPAKKVRPPKPKSRPIQKPKEKPLAKPKITKRSTPTVTKPEKIEVIEKALVRDIPAAVPVTSPAKSRQTLKADYYSQVYDAIAAKKRYPKKALRFRHEGSVKVRFSVDASGEITDYTIISSSGHRSFQRTVVELFRRIGRLEAPSEKLLTPLTMTITLNYILGE